MAGLALATTSANAGEIYSDDFSGSAAADLHGTTPDVTTGGETWVARSVYKADGSFSWESFATMSLAFTPVDGRVYTLDAKFENLTGNHWVQFGFGNGQPSVAANPNWSSRAWHLLRVAEDTSNAHNTGLTNITGLAAWSALGLLRYSEPLDARVVLDTTAGTNNWKATWYAKADSDATYTEVRGATLLANEDINSVGVSLFNTNKSGKLLSFSLSDDSAGAAATFPLTITPNATTSGNYDFEWDSQEGKLYDLVSDTSLATAPGGWDVYDPDGSKGPYGGIPSEGTTTSEPDVPGGGNPMRFFAVVEKDPPPLLSADFEANNGGFTSQGTGSIWVHGDPDSTGSLGGAVTTGNDGSIKCWGTNIGNPGTYAIGTETSLISPVIDLTGVPNATLSFAQAIDILAPGDTLVVNVIGDDISGGITVIESAVHTSTPDPDNTTANWGTVPSIAITGDQPVRIEWRFDGDGDGTYIGAYIDDVTVKKALP